MGIGGGGEGEGGGGTGRGQGGKGGVEMGGAQHIGESRHPLKRGKSSLEMSISLKNSPEYRNLSQIQH